MIDIQHVTKRYGSLYALRDVSLHVEKGSVLGLLGQNGAGKTTLINILTGYLAPTEGRALLAGHDALLEPEEARKHLGYLPEMPPLYDEMTVREYLRFAARLKGVEGRAVPAHVDEIMALCGLTQMQRRLLSHLSKGYRQRAGLAQALCGDPEILVLDEPTVGLDPKQITEIRALIRRRPSRRHTIPPPSSPIFAPPPVTSAAFGNESSPRAQVTSHRSPPLVITALRDFGRVRQ